MLKIKRVFYCGTTKTIIYKPLFELNTFEIISNAFSLKIVESNEWWQVMKTCYSLYSDSTVHFISVMADQPQDVMLAQLCNLLIQYLFSSIAINDCVFCLPI